MHDKTREYLTNDKVRKPPIMNMYVPSTSIKDLNVSRCFLYIWQITFFRDWPTQVTSKVFYPRFVYFSPDELTEVCVCCHFFS